MSKFSGLVLAPVKGVLRASDRFRDLTREVSRLDHRFIDGEASRRAWCTSFLEGVYRSGGPYMRRHENANVRRYLGKQSRCGTYVELMHEEVKEVLSREVLLGSRPVEVGFNSEGKVCKVAYVKVLKATGRHLFMAVGADGGIKTWYVTPEFKDRASYSHKGLSAK